MTDKKILEGYEEQFNTGHLLTESHVLVLMSYARGDAKKMLKEQLPDEDDIEAELIDDDYPGNPEYRKGYRKGAGIILKYLRKLL
jgi:hypothetical protein